MQERTIHFLKFEVRHIVLSIAFWLIGFALTFLLYANNVHANPAAGSTFSLNGVSIFHSDNVFLFILANNLVVAIILSLGGYFTGGVLTLVFNIWNGVFFGLLFQVTLQYMPARLWVVCIYGPLELLAFALFSAFGLEGFANVKRVVRSQPLQINLSWPFLIRLWIPTLLLLLAALLEALTTQL